LKRILFSLTCLLYCVLSDGEHMLRRSSTSAHAICWHMLMMLRIDADRNVHCLRIITSCPARRFPSRPRHIPQHSQLIVLLHRAATSLSPLSIIVAV
jgi:hypothetical protein